MSQVARFLESLQVHPRVEQQSLSADEAARNQILTAFPQLVPFKHPSYRAFICVMDWDHRLPSRNLVIRVFAYHNETSLELGQREFFERVEEIAEADKFPEFDVPDFEDIGSDEAYEADVSLDGRILECRFVSGWRRDIDAEEARQAEKLVMSSLEFKDLRSEYPKRSPQLGDPQAVQWVPPLESQHASWLIDVWYLVSLTGVEGEGRSFLVDVGGEQVVNTRKLDVRSGG